MKKLFKIGALSLALIASVLLLSTDNTHAATGAVSLQINSNTAASTCVYGTSLNIGYGTASFLAYNITGTFVTPATFYCTDYDGTLLAWGMSLQASTDLTGSNGQTIPRTGVFLKAFPNTLTAGACVPGTNTTTPTAIDSAKAILAKNSTIAGQVCTISATGIQLSVTVPANQGIGTYTGTLVLTAPWGA